MSLVKIDWQPGDAGYRKFGITIFVGFTIIGALVWFLGGSFAATRDTGEMVWGSLPWFVLIPASVMVVALAKPAWSRPFYVAWMTVGLVMGTIISTVLLAVFYWVVFGAVGLFFRLKGRDALRLRAAKADESLWTVRGEQSPREQYERQF
ncbi:MAG: hypothetical protein V3T86_06525 [Planctomycetota bacterium]